MDNASLSALEYLSPIIFSLLLTLVLGVITYRRNSVPGARAFGYILILEVFWILEIILELISPRLEEKIFWDSTSYIATFLIPLYMLSFARSYAGESLQHNRRRTWALMLVVPAAAQVMIFTNALHGLAMQAEILLPGQPFSYYTYDFGIPLWLVFLYSYAITLAAIYKLARQWLRQHGLYRTQTSIIIAGFLIPTLGTLLTVSGFQVGPQRDISPYTFAIADILIAVGLFRFGIFNIVPIARGLVMENMQDGVVVLDRRGRLIDMNQAAKNFIDQPEIKIAGQPLAGLPAGWIHEILPDLNQPTVHKEIKNNHRQPPQYFDVRLTSLPAPRGATSGILLQISDITRSRIAYDELEMRVRERTTELIDSVARLEQEIHERRLVEQALRSSETKFRTVIEQSTEGFLLLDTDGRVIEVNEAYEKLTGYPRDEIVGKPYWEFFCLLLPPEKRTPESNEYYQNLTLEVLRTGQFAFFNQVIEGIFCRKDGELCDIQQTLFLVRTDQGNRIGAVTRDVTLQKEAEMARNGAMEELAHAYDATLEGWSRALELRERETAGHSRKVVELTLKLAQIMGVNDAELVHIRRGALLHDIGKMGISDDILRKRGDLSDEEAQEMRKHPVYAYDLLAPIDFLKPALDIPYGHHEHWDGSGYPRGLKGQEIPLSARIFSVVDVWEALSEDRFYRKAWARPQICDYIRSLAGIQFDPQVVEVFLKLVEG